MGSEPAVQALTFLFRVLCSDTTIGPWYHAALLFSGLGSIVLLFVLLFSQQIREDLVCVPPIMFLTYTIENILCLRVL